MSAADESKPTDDVATSATSGGPGPTALTRTRTAASFLLQQQAYIAYQQRKQNEKAREKIVKARSKTAKKLAKHSAYPASYWAAQGPGSLPAYGYDPQTGLASPATPEASRVVEGPPTPPVAAHGYPTAGYCTTAEKELARLEYETAKIRAKAELKLLKKQQEAAHKASKQLKKQQQYYESLMSSSYGAYSPSMYDQPSTYYRS